MALVATKLTEESTPVAAVVEVSNKTRQEDAIPTSGLSEHVPYLLIAALSAH